MFSGAGWLLAVAATVGDGTVFDLIVDGTVWKVLTATQFGHVSIARLASALALFVLCQRRAIREAESMPTVVLASALVCSIAWSGHSGAGAGGDGALYLAIDAVHLLAAGAWVGGLVPLALLFNQLEKGGIDSTQRIAVAATHQFSKMGIATVLAITVTGAINSYHLVGSLSGMVDTQYGQLLLLKLNVFAAMLVLAAVNKFVLTPKVSSTQTWRNLKRNSLYEAGLGMIAIIIVGVLGTIPPAAHAGVHLHEHVHHEHQ